MLTALMPASATASSVTANEKDRLREPAPDEASTLPGDMLATLISTPMALQERSAAMRLQPAATAATAGAAGAAGAASAASAAGVLDATGRPRQSANIQDELSLSRTQGNSGP